MKTNTPMLDDNDELTSNLLQTIGVLGSKNGKMLNKLIIPSFATLHSYFNETVTIPPVAA